MRRRILNWLSISAWLSGILFIDFIERLVESLKRSVR